MNQKRHFDPFERYQFCPGKAGWLPGETPGLSGLGAGQNSALDEQR